MPLSSKTTSVLFSSKLFLNFSEKVGLIGISKYPFQSCVTPYLEKFPVPKNNLLLSLTIIFRWCSPDFCQILYGIFKSKNWKND